ncbi:hypothetical protein CHUAL_002944 [Chamberlinius hualienensis]
MEARGLNVLRRFLINRPSYVIGKRLISTSSKNKETTEIAKSVLKKKPKVIADAHEFKDDWITYGFSYVNEKFDRWAMHAVAFSSFTILIVGGGFILAYQPDLRGRDWIRREAYIELHRREKLGLPLVDPELVDPSRIELPSDEELGDTDIII